MYCRPPSPGKRERQSVGKKLRKQSRRLCQRQEAPTGESSQAIVRVGESGTLQVSSRSQALAKARREIRKYIPAGRDLADELIRDRRAEAECEEQGDSRR
jgi:hypothetical protein